ncbi:MAG: DUF3015 domain-containing protein [Nitrospirota bacterium]
MRKQMKRALITCSAATFAVALAWTPASAAEKDKDMSVKLPGTSGPMAKSGPGCGLGYLLFQGQRGLLPQILAATTNGTSGNQTFGMTTGTSGCSQDGIVSREHEAAVYAQATIENLSEDMAQGHGEHLVSLATLIGVPVDLQPRFFHLTQEHYSVLFPTADTDALQMLATLQTVLAADPVLASVASPI